MTPGCLLSAELMQKLCCGMRGELDALQNPIHKIYEVGMPKHETHSPGYQSTRRRNRCGRLYRVLEERRNSDQCDNFRRRFYRSKLSIWQLSSPLLVSYAVNLETFVMGGKTLKNLLLSLGSTHRRCEYPTHEYGIACSDVPQR